MAQLCQNQYAGPMTALPANELARPSRLRSVPSERRKTSPTAPATTGQASYLERLATLVATPAAKRRRVVCSDTHLWSARTAMDSAAINTISVIGVD